MLLRRLKLVNYGGIYNGMGLKEIEIDFTKCQHRIILIKGDNGSGKSTIEMALKPLPDDSSAFIRGENASKEIEYYDEFNNTIYSIVFLHEITPNGSRKSRGYITKTINGISTELNPSGNITSCKDIIFEELQLDPNYITLSQLSATKRGIADLKPSDRKRYVNAILTTTDVYNDMYKTLSKKASNYKAMMQSATTKLDNIGNLAQLDQSIKSVSDRIDKLERILGEHYEIMNKEKGMLQTIDPDNKIRDKIESLMTRLKEYETKRDDINKGMNNIYRQYTSLINKTITPDDINKLSDSLYKIKNEISNTRSKIDMIIESRRVDSEELQVKTAKLKSINSVGSLSEVRRIKLELETKKENIERRWNGIVNINSISADEFMSLYNILKDMIGSLSSIGYVWEGNLDMIYKDYINKISKIEDEIDRLVEDNNRISVAEDKVLILEQRPKTCKDDSCPFIADALKAQVMIEKIKSMRNNCNTMAELNTEKQVCEDALERINTSKYIRDMYMVNQRLLKSLNFGFDTFESCMSNLKSNSAMIMSTMNNMLEYVNDIEEYRVILKSINDINNKYNSLSSQEDFINMITNDIERLNAAINKDNDIINSENIRIDELTNQFNQISNIYDIYNFLYTNKVALDEVEEIIEVIKEEIDTNKANIDKIQAINSDIQKLTVNISELNEQLEPLKKEKSALEYKRTVSIEYSKEVDTYTRMYNKVDTLKYYCSPTTGIQLLFADIYLNKIIGQANRILQGLFRGDFALLPLVITENEFRIPVAVNGGINHDDITSMSSAQISLISMIISIALLSQTSTKLNIIVGDEIDAPFDGENRREFISILYQLMGLVNSSQCVLISHNSEISMDDCDVILLRSDNDIITSGNIIWSYR